MSEVKSTTGGVVIVRHATSRKTATLMPGLQTKAAHHIVLGVAGSSCQTITPRVQREEQMAADTPGESAYIFHTTSLPENFLEPDQSTRWVRSWSLPYAHLALWGTTN